MSHPKIDPQGFLANINSPDELKKLSLDQLPDFCQDLRDYIIDIVSVYGGHFGASLGVIELTAALHYVYDTPDDLLVWDVGHQAYGHKIITGRRDQFHTNRTFKGLSGFPKRSESPYDTFGVGHSSTSISAALGMAVANRQLKNGKKTVAIIGDGAMTGGMAFEAMNNAGAEKADLLVILNDNKMSIDPNVGALKEYLADITASETYNKMRNDIYDILGHFKKAGEHMRKIASRMERALATALTPGGLFRALGFRYFGPVDGHDVKGLVRQLRDLNKIKGPKLLHIVTVKGKGFAPAELDQVKWHASSSPFDKITGKQLSAPAKKTGLSKYQDVFAETLIELCKKDERIIGVTAAMPSGTGLIKPMNAFPERMFDVGIAEQHAVTFAAGMATQGFRPFVAIYSTFLQRGYDQVIHDVAIQKLPLIFCMDRAGLVGADGPTHHGLYDVAYMRCVPNMIVSAPMDGDQLQRMMNTAYLYQHGPFAIRYPRGNVHKQPPAFNEQTIEIGKGRMLHKGETVAFLSYGTIGLEVEKAVMMLRQEGVHVGHADMRFAKPLDEDLLVQLAVDYDHLITVEDGTRVGGFGSAVAEFLIQQNQRPGLTIIGVPDKLIEHGTQAELYAQCGLDAGSLTQQVKQRLNQLVS